MVIADSSVGFDADSSRSRTSAEESVSGVRFAPAKSRTWVARVHGGGCSQLRLLKLTNFASTASTIPSASERATPENRYPKRIASANRALTVSHHVDSCGLPDLF